jgi:hypothetical protein
MVYLLKFMFMFPRQPVFFGVPHLATCIFFYIEPELGEGIDPGILD